MKKKLYALSGVFMIVLVIAGLWATKATSVTDMQNTRGADPISHAPGLSMEQMAQGATFIVIGQCTETQSQWAGRNLYTLATVLVTESLKGAPPQTLKIAIPGGIDSNRRFPIAMTYAGAPQFAPGEEVVVFLDDPQSEIPNSYAVMGFSQGKFSVGKAQDGEPVVTSDMNTTPVRKGMGLTRGNPQVISLSEFKALVRSYLNK
jgi:hypothetical protein